MNIHKRNLRFSCIYSYINTSDRLSCTGSCPGCHIRRAYKIKGKHYAWCSTPGLKTLKSLGFTKQYIVNTLGFADNKMPEVFH